MHEDQVCFHRLQFGAIETLIERKQGSVLVGQLVVDHVDFRDLSVDLWRDPDIVGLQIGIVGRRVVALEIPVEVDAEKQCAADDKRAEDDQSFPQSVRLILS